ncbi:MAG: mevalonate kinase [Candidatus Micrarchaeota archaeon]
MKKLTGEGTGKIILLGEHFVVHGAPAIAAGIDNKAEVEIELAAENEIVTTQTVMPELSRAGIAAVLNAMGIKEKFKVHLTGNLPTYGGLGSSAAFCVALVHAFAAYKNLQLNKEQVNKFAYEGEKAFHGNPSGIDNFMATYGGVVLFKRGEGQIFKFIEPHSPLQVVVGFSGKLSPTTKMVALVAQLKKDDEDRFKQLMDEASELVYKGVNAVEKGKLEELGELMNENQALLSELGVSDEKNDEMVKLMLAAGALGAKVTGGGGGGCCIALARDKVAAMEIERTLKKSSYDAFITVVKGK